MLQTLQSEDSLQITPVPLAAYNDIQMYLKNRETSQFDPLKGSGEKKNTTHWARG